MGSDIGSERFASQHIHDEERRILAQWNDDKGVDWRTLRKKKRRMEGEHSVSGWRESLKERKKEKRQPKRGIG